MDIKGVYNQDPVAQLRKNHHGKGKPADGGEEVKPGRGDQVSFSKEAQDAMKANEAAKNDPVEEIKTSAKDKVETLYKSVEQQFAGGVDAVKNSASYQQALQDLASGKGVQTTADGHTIYYGAAEEGVPAYVIYDGRIFLQEEDGDGFWSINNGYGNIPEDVVIKAPQEGEEGYGASTLSLKQAEGLDFIDFLRSQAEHSEEWAKIFDQFRSARKENDRFDEMWREAFRRYDISYLMSQTDEED